MKINVLRDIVQKVRAVKGDKTNTPAPSPNSVAADLPAVPAPGGPNTVTGSGGGSIIADSQGQNQY